MERTSAAGDLHHEFANFKFTALRSACHPWGLTSITLPAITDAR